MTKGERLIWELFEMVRELMPATHANAERFNLWAAKFHEMEHGDVGVPAAAATLPSSAFTSAEPAIGNDEDEVEPEPAEDPHEHGVPSRPIGKRRKK